MMATKLRANRIARRNREAAERWHKAYDPNPGGIVPGSLRIGGTPVENYLRGADARMKQSIAALHNRETAREMEEQLARDMDRDTGIPREVRYAAYDNAIEHDKKLWEERSRRIMAIVQDPHIVKVRPPADPPSLADLMSKDWWKAHRRSK